jgi:hypothetical protein
MELLSIMSVFILLPAGALAIAAVFLVLYLRSKSATCLVTAAIWALYFIYESLMQARILCTGECNIRVDLLLIYPFLLILSLLAIVLFLFRRNRASPATRSRGEQ